MIFCFINFNYLFDIKKDYWANPDTSPNKYHEMKWQIDLETHYRKNCEHKAFSGTTDYSLCVEGKLPLTRKIRLNERKKGILKNHLEFINDNLIIEREDPNIHHVGRQQLCEGDSGTGHWMKGLETLGQPERFVLVGISTRTKEPCGSISQVQKTTYTDIINWIKEKVLAGLDDTQISSTTQKNN